MSTRDPPARRPIGTRLRGMSRRLSGAVRHRAAVIVGSRRFRWPAAGLALACAAFIAYVFLAPFEQPQSKVAPAGTVVLDANGVILQRDTSAGIRIPVTLAEIAPAVIDATIAAEDERFRHHPGVDPIAVTREVITFWDDPSGASTITQQLARNIYLDDGGGPLPIRKLREAAIAFQLEAHLSKDDVLEAYLNTVYYGRGAHGIEAAARVYFGTSARNLDLAQAAMLAGLPQLPAAYDPATDMAAARARQAYVLGRMEATGAISSLDAEAARSRALGLTPGLAPPIGPHFTLFALDELARLRPDLAGRPGLIIETTLDAALQREAERIVEAHLSALIEENVHNAGAVVLDPATGAILVMVGNAESAGADHSGDVNVTLAPRQPGSALKPFLYAAALERGFTAASPLLDIPTTFQTPGGPYAPGNYDRRFHGVVPLRVALASSFNVPAVRTQDAIGTDALLEILHRFGMDVPATADTFGLALTLGGGEVALVDLTAAYGALANQGLHHEPFAVVRVRDSRTGEVLYEREATAPTRVLSPEHAFIVSDMLSDSAARIPGFGEQTPLDTAVRAAVKTGTTTGFRDNWTAGYTPDRAVGVWAGNADGQAMRNVSGIDGAAPIWRDLLHAATASLTPRWYEPPPGLVRATVCTPTGLLPGPDCPSPVEEWFVDGTVPAAAEDYYLRGPGGELRVNPPLEARAWAQSAGLTLGGPSRAGAQAAALHIVQPADGSVLYLAPELAAQEVVIRAAAPGGATAVTFHVDGELAGTAPGADPHVVWRLEVGTHRIDAAAAMPDGSTVRSSATYEVRSR